MCCLRLFNKVKKAYRKVRIVSSLFHRQFVGKPANSTKMLIGVCNEINSSLNNYYHVERGEIKSVCS
jgi:hypothetical protein